MDPISIDALSSLIVQAAAGEAGKSAWSGLLALARRAFGRSHSGHDALERAATGDQGAAAHAAEQLVARSLADTAVAEALRAWMFETRAAAGSVANTISGRAQIHGNVVQARDIGGSINFH